MKTKITSSCFGFGCAIKALLDGQSISRADWKLTLNNNNVIIRLQRYDISGKNKKFIACIDDNEIEYNFTTEDILSDNWVTCEYELPELFVEDLSRIKLRFMGIVDHNAPKSSQFKFIKSRSPIPGDIFLSSFTDKSERVHNLIYYYNDSDTEETFEFIEIVEDSI